MPGIVGLVTKMPRACAEPQLLRMVEALRHESFYVTGTFIDEKLGLYVGWAARKDSFSDGMPVRNERGDVVLIFAGEEYPAPGTARDLKERGHNCELEGPSYLAHAYEEDPDFLKNLNGRFQGILAFNGYASMRPRTHFILPLKPKRFSRFAPNCAAWIRAGSVNS